MSAFAKLAFGDPCAHAELPHQRAVQFVSSEEVEVFEASNGNAQLGVVADLLSLVVAREHLCLHEQRESRIVVEFVGGGVVALREPRRDHGLEL